MKLFIPEKHEIVRLLTPFTLRVRRDYSTISLLDKAGIEYLPQNVTTPAGLRYQSDPNTYSVTLPAGTLFKLTSYRIVKIPNRYNEVSRLTIKIIDSGPLGFKGFLYVKLEDFRNAELAIHTEPS